jgi:hypothetical protein
MPLIHIYDLETMSDHLRANIVKYMLETHNITFLDDNTERDMYNFILLTIQNYVVNPPALVAKPLACDNSFTKRLCRYLALASATIALYSLCTASSTTV